MMWKSVVKREIGQESCLLKLTKEESLFSFTVNFKDVQIITNKK